MYHEWQPSSIPSQRLATTTHNMDKSIHTLCHLKIGNTQIRFTRTFVLVVNVPEQSSAFEEDDEDHYDLLQKGRRHKPIASSEERGHVYKPPALLPLSSTLAYFSIKTESMEEHGWSKKTFRPCHMGVLAGLKRKQADTTCGWRDSKKKLAETTTWACSRDSNRLPQRPCGRAGWTTKLLRPLLRVR
jgi:hypothetical protein